MPPSQLKGPLEVVLNLTNRCNMRCLHCFYESGESKDKRKRREELSDAEIFGLMDEIISLKPFNLCFFGGEPLLRKNLLLECAGKLTANGIRVNVITNGYFIDLDTARDMKEAGIADIEVSIDGATAQTHDRLRGLNGAFEKVMDAFRNLKRVNFPIYEGSFVAAKFNIHEIKDLIFLLEKEEVPVLFIRPMLILGTARNNIGELLPGPHRYREIKRIIREFYGKGLKIEVDFYDPLSHVLFFLQDRSFFGLDILADGSLILSPHVQVRVGNLRKHRIEDYWRAGYQHVWKHPRLKDLLAHAKTYEGIRRIHDYIDDYHFDLMEEPFDEKG